jgi:transcriptional regulator with XRE-family HTH domain
MGDAENPSPAVQRRRLRTELRRAREEAGLTRDQVSVALEMSLSKVVRIESGEVRVSANDLKALLDLYHVQDPGEVANLLTLARIGRERPTWQNVYKDVAPPRLLEFIELEAAASSTRNFQPLMVPGLLQTKEYARVILGQLNRGRGLTDDRIDSMVEVRMKRQELLERDDAPELFFVLDEAATRRLVGGRGVMRSQLNRLTEVATRARVTVEVLPFSTGAYPALNGSFVIQEFPDPADSDVLYQEGPEGDEISSDNPELISRYRTIFEELRRASLGRQGSLSFLNALAKELA